MGDMADFSLDNLYDFDEVYCNGEIDEETNEVIKSPFMYEQKVHGPGNCPICKGLTHLINGKYGLFYGCNNFPKCKGRRGI
jgi:ssDNA-binding Zn-finger/Zn-ribbon topoisomerase 1